MSKQILVGHYQLGFRNFALYADPNNASGTVKLAPDDKSKSSEVFIGVDGSWPEAVSTLLHELFEVAFIDVNGRFKRCPTYCEEPSDFNFFLTHNEFSEAAERVGYVLIDALKDLSKVYKNHQKENAKKGK